MHLYLIGHCMKHYLYIFGIHKLVVSIYQIRCRSNSAQPIGLSSTLQRLHTSMFYKGNVLLRRTTGFPVHFYQYKVDIPKYKRNFYALMDCKTLSLSLSLSLSGVFSNRIQCLQGNICSSRFQMDRVMCESLSWFASTICFLL